MAALRAEGADQADPVRWAYLDALARRASDLSGAVREAVLQRLVTALAAYPGRQAPGVGAGGPPAAPAAGPLADLVRQLDRLWAAAGDGPAVAGSDAAPAGTATAPTELKALRLHRSGWTRLRTGQQLSRSLAKVPDNPGPLNSHLLVLRALQQLQQLSPDYLQSFMAYAEALLWVDQANSAAPPAAGKAASIKSRARRRPPAGTPPSQSPSGSE